MISTGQVKRCLMLPTNSNGLNKRTQVMKREKIKENLFCVFEEDCQPTTSRDSWNEDSDLIDDLGFDSLDIVESLMGIEMRLGIEIPDESIWKGRTIGDYLNVIEQVIN